MVLPPSRVARGGPPTTAALIPPLPPSPWQAAHFCAKMGAPSCGVPLPGGSPVPSGMMAMSQGANSCAVVDFPRLGPSASAAPASMASASETAPKQSLRVDMPDLPFPVHRPAGDAVEMLAREGQHRRWFRRLSALRDNLGAGRLHVAALVEGAALQHGRTAVPAPGHAEAGKGLRQDRLLERRLGPAPAAVGRYHDFGDPAGA